MSAILYVCIGALVIIVVLLLIIYLPVKADERKYTKWLRKLSLPELERHVFRYNSEYFKLIGEEKESVLEFKKIIENKDIASLHKKWNSDLSGSFLVLEKETGYVGRPMLMDYYYFYELEIKELYRRSKETSR